MQLFNVRKSNQGFTLLEVLTVLVMIGILSAISAPSLLGWYQRSKVNRALIQVQGALQEAQRQAIRGSRSCTMSLGSDRVTGACLATGSRMIDGVTMQSSVTAFQFNFKGTVSASDGAALSQPITIVLSSNDSRVQPCLVLSTPLGLVRTGTYSGTGSPTDSQCLPAS